MLRVPRVIKVRLALSRRRTPHRSCRAQSVIKENVPSGFLRLATSLFHSPKSKTVEGPGGADRNFPQRSIRVVFGELRAFSRVGGDGQELAIGRHAR